MELLLFVVPLMFAVGAMLTADIPTPRRSMQEALYDHLPVAAGVTLFYGGMAEVVDGLLYPAGTNGEGYAVFIAEHCDNSGGGDGDLLCKIEFRSSYLFASEDTLTRGDVGTPVYALDDQTFTKTAGGTFAGHIAHWEDESNAWIDLPGQLGYGRNIND